jgi:hypothetical protein
MGQHRISGLCLPGAYATWLVEWHPAGLRSREGTSRSQHQNLRFVFVLESLEASRSREKSGLDLSHHFIAHAEIG